MLRETRTKIVTVQELRRDTVIVTERDSAMVRALLECDSAGNVIMSQLDIAQGKLNAKVGNIKFYQPPNAEKVWIFEAPFIADSLRQEIALRDKIINKATTSDKIQYIDVPRDLIWWQTTLMWTGGITLIIIVGIIAYIITKRWKKR